MATDGDFMFEMSEFLGLSETEKDFRKLYEKYPLIHQNPPKNLQQLLENEINFPEYREVFRKHFSDYPPRCVLSENLFQLCEDVAVMLHQRFVPGFTHYHEFFEITYVLSGTDKNFINGKLYELKQGDLCILSPNVWHCPATHLESDVTCNILVRSSNFEKIFFPILQRNQSLRTFFTRALTIPNGKSFLKFSTENDSEVQAIIFTMLREYSQKNLYYSSMLNELMSALFILLLRNHSNTIGTAFSDKMNFSQKISEVLEYIRKNLQDINFPELARHFSYSERQLARLLLKYTGKNFSEILQEFRIQKAGQLLRDENISVSEVIEQCGYKNHNYFYKKFKEYCGKTPAQYRKDFLSEKLF